MATVTLDELRGREPDVDLAKIEATTEEDIRRHMIEDGEDPNAAPSFGAGASHIRHRLGMTQEQFAAALQVPLATLRNWEQGRVVPDPAARALLKIVAHAPEVALAALRA